MTNSSRSWMPPRAAWAALAALLLGLAGCATSSAQPIDPPPPPGTDADPPGRVGRIGDTQGQVWIYDDSAGEWVTAARNRPVTSGDRVATEGNARAEIEVGSTTLLLDGGSELEAVRLDDDTLQFELHDGSVAARLRSGDAAREFELLTGEARLRPDRAGLYRVDRVDERTQATVMRGQALLQGDGAAVTVMPGQRAEMWREPPGSGAAQYAIADPRRDAFAAWVQDRDRADARSASTRYVSPEMTGVDDLDRHGRWEHSDDYGALWVPRVVIAGWAPYRYGHWVFLHPWGWTWVDDAPWGFAPFHYGRWVHLHGRWCWAPGRYVARPVFAPALVGWVGGPRFSVSISVGAPTVGWFPLAPHEVYVPGYRVSPRYVRNVNVTHVTNITNVTTIVNAPDRYVQNARYANRGIDHAVTFVPSNVMTSRQPIGVNAWNARDPRSRDWNRAPVMPAAPVTAPVPRVAAGDGGVRVVPGRGEVRIAPPPPTRAVPRERPPSPADAGGRPAYPPSRGGQGDGVPDFARSPRQPLPQPHDARPELGRTPRPDAPSTPPPVPRAMPTPQSAAPAVVAPLPRDRGFDRDRDHDGRPDRTEQRPMPVPKVERRDSAPAAGPAAAPPQPQRATPPPAAPQQRVMPPAAVTPPPAPRVQQAPPQPSPQVEPRSPRNGGGGGGREGRGGGNGQERERENRGGRGERG